MTGPLEFVEAAHKQAEEIARAATPGPWTAHKYSWGDDFEASIGTYDETNVVGHGYEGGGVVNWADAVFIAANDPAAVLRRIAAERKLLAEHANDYGECVRCAGDDGEVVVNGMIHSVRTCAPHPCATIRALAEGWGWQEEQQ